MGLFGGGKVRKIDTELLKSIARQNRERQAGIAQALRGELAPGLKEFETKRGELSQRVPQETERLLTQYRGELAGLGPRQREANLAATQTFREQAFRDVPQLQQAIRQSLGAGGMTGSAAARSRLADPILGAHRAARDFSTALEMQRLQDEARREEAAVGTSFQARQAAVEKQLGLDEGTLNFLTEAEREDLIRESENLLGIEQTYGQNILAAEQLNQAQQVAADRAKQARRGAILQSLGQFGGAALGFGLGGGPLGASLGAQLGGAAGSFAGGGAPTFDPTLMFALAQRGAPAPNTASTAPRASGSVSMGAPGVKNPRSLNLPGFEPGNFRPAVMPQVPGSTGLFDPIRQRRLHVSKSLRG